MDGLISAHLATAATSSSGSIEPETLKSHFDRLQESRYAVEMLAELTATLEGRHDADQSVTPLMLLRKLQTISGALCPDTKANPDVEETAYLPKFVSYLIRLVQLIIDANPSGERYNRDVAIFVKSPQVL